MKPEYSYWKRIIILLLSLILSSGFIVSSAQENLPEKVITTQFEQVKIVKMKPGTDLLACLNETVKSEKIKNAVILSGIGSVTDYHFHVVSSKDLPPDQEYPGASVAKDLTTVQGYILNGRVHAHITLSDENSVVGGHLEPGTKALTFFIVTLGILPDHLEMDDLDKYRINGL